MKKVILPLCLIISCFVFPQVGINTKKPNGIFNIDGSKDNPTTGTPTSAEALNDFTTLSNGYVGIGTIAPTAKLHIVRDLTTENFAVRIQNINPLADMGDTPTTTQYTTVLVDKTTGDIVQGNPSVNNASIIYPFLNINTNSLGTSYVVDSQQSPNSVIWVSNPRGSGLCDIQLPNPNSQERRALSIIAGGNDVSVCGYSLYIANNSTINTIPSGKRATIVATGSSGGQWIVVSKDF